MYPFCVCLPLWILPLLDGEAQKNRALNIQVTWERGQRSIGSQKRTEKWYEAEKLHACDKFVVMSLRSTFLPSLLLWKLNFDYNHSTSSLSIFERRHADDENQNRFDENLEDGCLCNKSINIYYRHVIHRKKEAKKARSIWVQPKYMNIRWEIYIKFSMPPRVIIFAAAVRAGTGNFIQLNFSYIKFTPRVANSLFWCIMMKMSKKGINHGLIRHHIAGFWVHIRSIMFHSHQMRIISVYSIELLLGAHTSASTMPTSIKRQEKRMIRDDAEWIVCAVVRACCVAESFVAESANAIWNFFHHF